MYKNKPFYLILLLSIFYVDGLSQIRNIQGKVIDINSEKALEYAVVSIFNEDSSLISGGFTDSLGNFAIDKIKQNPAYITITFIGYQDYFKELKSVNHRDLDLGIIPLKINYAILNEFEVEAEKSTVFFDIDKRVYQVDKDLGALGGTSLDALKNIPGLTVGVDNSVQLRNQSPTIFIDGRPTLLTLEQIPADDIDRIEVITNPSAKYVASASGGIVNIILKQNLKPGYWGSLRAGTGTNNRNNFNFNLSFREKRFSLQASGGFNTAFNNNNGYSNRINLENDIETGRFNLTNNNESNRYNINGRISSDIKLSKNSSLRISYSYTPNSVVTEENQDFEVIDNDQNTVLTGFRINDLENTWRTHWGSINYKKDYKKEGKVLTSDVTVISSSNRNNSTFENYLELGNFLIPGIIQQNQGAREADYIVWQLDYENPILENMMLETGLRAAYKQSFADFEVFFKEDIDSDFIQDNSLSNYFRVDDFVGAAYANLKGKIGSIGWQAGLRYEQTNFVAEQLVSGEKFSYIYPSSLNDIDKTLFPSVYLSRKIGGDGTMQINFSRKIGRPGYMELIPFITYADRQIIQIGNPVLAPSFIHLAEWNYSLSKPGIQLLTGIYGRNENGAITRVVYPSELDPEVLISTYENGQTQNTFGFESSLKKSFFEKLDFTLNGNAFYTDISIAQETINARNQGWSWNAKAMLQYSFFEKLSIQVNGNYEAPRIIPQGKILSIWFADFSANYKITKKLNASFAVSDVFNSKRYRTLFETTDLIQETSRRWEVRFIKLNLSWRFGEPGKSIFNRRNRYERDPGNKGTEIQEL